MKAVRWTLAAVVLLSATLLVSAVIGRYVRTGLLNTDAFVSATAPLASDAAVQTLIADQVTDQITTHLNSEHLNDQVGSLLDRFGLPPGMAAALGPLADRATAFIRPYVERFLRSEAFAQIWSDLIRLAHGDVVNILSGRAPPGAALAVNGDQVTLDLAPVVDQVKTALVADGLTAVKALPEIPVQVTVVRSDRISTIQRYARIFNRYADWLPWAGLALLLAGLLLVPRRLIGAAIWLGLMAILLVVLLLAVPWGRDWVGTRLGTSGLDRAAAVDTYNRLVHDLVVAARLCLIVVAALALVLCAAVLLRRRRADQRPVQA